LNETGASHFDSTNTIAGFLQIPTPQSRGDSHVSASCKTLLLGLGNDILCDDAIGLLVAREIRRRAAGKEGIAVRETCEMGLALLDYIVGFKNLVVVDAIQTRKAPPGSIHELDGTELKVLPVTSPHFLGVGEMITLGKQLGLQVPENLKIFAIEIEDGTTITDQLTPVLAKALPQIVERVWGALVERVVPI
jgi:hydrogenase maturation protease